MQLIPCKYINFQKKIWFKYNYTKPYILWHLLTCQLPKRHLKFLNCLKILKSIAFWMSVSLALIKILLSLGPSIYSVLHSTSLPIASSIWLNTSKIALSIPAVTFALICIHFAKVMTVYMQLPNSILKTPLLKL